MYGQDFIDPKGLLISVVPCIKGMQLVIRSAGISYKISCSKHRLYLGR